MLMFFRIMATIAERLILRFSATAERNSIANSVCFSVCGLNWNAAAHPQRPANANRWIFNRHDGLLKLRLQQLPIFLVSYDETPRGAIASLLNYYPPALRVVRLADEVPDSTGSVAETSGSAQFFDVD